MDILDANGNFTGVTAMKSVAHRDGLFHQTVHIWLYTQEGQLLLQQRGKNKDTHPLLWDVSVAGHIGAGEAIETAAVREIAEEIGLMITAADLQKIGVFKSVHQHRHGRIDCEFHHTYLSELKVPIDRLEPQASEVALLNLMAVDDFCIDVQEGKNPEKYVPHSQDYYRAVCKEINRCLT